MKFSGFHWKVAALVSLLFVAMSADNHPEPQSLVVGDELPKMKQAVELSVGAIPQPQEGRYTLVCFWASYDAQSRAQNRAYSTLIAETVSDKIAYKALSLDRDEDVHRLTLELDKVDGAHSLCPSELQAELRRGYRLGEQLKSYLVDGSGRIVSVNPSVQELERFYLL